jgi:hypothetical protein
VTVTIPVRHVHAAYVAILQATGQQVGDGDAPATIDTTRPWGWVAPAGRPANPPRMGGGEPSALLRLRVTSTAVDTADAGPGTARAQAQWLDDRLKTAMLTGTLPAGDGWRITGRWRETTADVPEDGAHTIHADYRLLVAAIPVAP